MIPILQKGNQTETQSAPPPARLGKAGSEIPPGSEFMSLDLGPLAFSQPRWNPLPREKCLGFQRAEHRQQGSRVIQQKEEQRKRRGSEA